MLFPVLLAVQILVALLLVGVILLQQGKGATAGAAFGSGASSTVFGSRGSASFLTRVTAVLATVFFANCLLLVYMQGQAVKPQSLLDQVQLNAPAVPAPAAGATTELDIAKLVEQAEQGKPLDVPSAPASDVPVAPPVASQPPVPAATEAPATTP